ncbi:MAG: TetR/AcrR family transcriptional regulator [Sandaracinus sp.]
MTRVRSASSRDRKPKAAPRARLELDARRAQLLVLGRELFGRRAYDEIQIEEIAERAGVSKGLLYHYFGSKRGFYVATVETAASALLEATLEDPSAPPPERALRSLETYLDFVSENAPAFKALLGSGIGTDAEVAGIVERVRAEFVRRFLVGLGLEGQSRPVFELAARSWIGLVEAASLAWIDRGGVDRATLRTFLLDTLTQVLLAALRLDPEAPITLAPPGAG